MLEKSILKDVTNKQPLFAVEKKLLEASQPQNENDLQASMLEKSVLNDVTKKQSVFAVEKELVEASQPQNENNEFKWIHHQIDEIKSEHVAALENAK